MNLSFAGCGFLGIYHVGVAVCFKKYAPHLLLDKIGGASAGALAACCLLCDLPLGHMTNDFFRIGNEARRYSLGPFSPSFNIQTCLMEGLQEHLPDDVHLRVSGRLHISLTRVYDGQNVIISQFSSREDVLQALLCACFIPGFSGVLPPRFHGVRYMDGAFSDNLPILDENTVTVSPFCGESDICPRDQSAQLFHLNFANTSIEISKQNINRFRRILFPPPSNVLSKICQNGFDDALQFLQRNNLINCTRCVAVQSTFVVQETISHNEEDYDPECNECKKHRKDALIGNMPETVLTVIQSYLDTANKGLANWVFKNPGAKLLQTLSLPATLPVEILYATISKMVLLLPIVSNNILHILKILLENLNDIRNNRKSAYDILFDDDSLECEGNLHSNQKNYGSSMPVIINENSDRMKDTIITQSIFDDVDEFEHMLKVTAHHDAIYAYYYMDDANHLTITEIFDMTDRKFLPIEVRNEDEFTSSMYDVQSPSEWNVSSDVLNRSISNDNLCSSLIENNNNNFDDLKSEFIGLHIDEITSDNSDPEADRYITEPMKKQQTMRSDSITLDIE